MTDLDKARIAISDYIQSNRVEFAALAKKLHPALTAEDVERFLAGVAPEDEEERGVSVHSVMMMFAGSLED